MTPGTARNPPFSFRFDGRQAGDWLSSLGDDNFFAIHYPLEQFGQVGFGLVDVEFCGHIKSSFRLKEYYKLSHGLSQQSLTSAAINVKRPRFRFVIKGVEENDYRFCLALGPLGPVAQLDVGISRFKNPFSWSLAPNKAEFDPLHYS